MTIEITDIDSLFEGPRSRFANWPDDPVPDVAAGVYTIWDGDEFIYVGMAGRGLSADDLHQRRQQGKRAGLWTRLNSHASGRRSGDQFCVYVADRLVLTGLTRQQIDDIADGDLSLDDLTRDHIRDKLSFRWITTVDGHEALHLERDLQAGDHGFTRPMLNPR